MANLQEVILKIKLSGALQEVIARSDVSIVSYDESTTLAEKLAEILVDIGTRAKSTDVTAEIKAAINELIGGAPDTYDTLKEIADYIEEHEGVKDALQAAIGDKLDKSVFTTFCNSISKLGALAGKDKVADADLEEALKQKIDTASQGSHSHTNKESLDKITEDKLTAWDGAAGKAHEHSNADALAKVTNEKVSAWDAKSTIFVQESEPGNMAEGDLWIQPVKKA